LVGILAALRWHPGARVVVTVPTDTPFLPDDLISRLAAALSATGARASVASSAGRIHPVIGAWDPALAPELHHAVSERGMRRAGDWAAAIGAVPVVWPDRPIDPFENLNTPADLATAERLALRTGGDTARSR
jgi:molybdopterin-guanine dinucleotide biosynthesis protein A